MRLVKDGEVLPESSYTRAATLAGRSLTGLVDARKALALFDGGATIVFQGLHRYWPPLTRLIAELELALGHPCQANAYLTPVGAQGFAVHSDTHDVLVLQTAGRKQWEVHRRQDGVEEPVFEPGHVMYMPTGTPHAARTQDTMSLHITIGINQLTWRGLVTRAISELAAKVPDEHLPAGYLDDPQALAHQLGRHLHDIADELRDVDPAVAVEDEVRRFLTQRPPRLPGGLADVVALGDLDRRLALRRRRRAPVRAARARRLRRGPARRPVPHDAGLDPAGPGRGAQPGRAHPRRPAVGRAEQAGAVSEAGSRGAPGDPRAEVTAARSGARSRASAATSPSTAPRRRSAPSSCSRTTGPGARRRCATRGCRTGWVTSSGSAHEQRGSGCS